MCVFYFLPKLLCCFFPERHDGVCVGTNPRTESLCISDGVSHRGCCIRGEIICGTLPRRRANVSLWIVRSLPMYERRSVNPELFAATEIICLLFVEVRFCFGEEYVFMWTHA